MTHALVIDDHDQILEIVREKLQSLDHTCDTASSQEEAEELLRRSTYDYILLDLAIPLRFRGKPDSQFGRNLLAKIRGPLGLQSTIVIVMTANELGSYHVGVELMKEGATDFVGKPFGNSNPLERKILEALAKRFPNVAEHQGKHREAAAKPFAGAAIDFYKDRVEINGQRLTGETSQMRAVLDCLRKKMTAEDKTPMTGFKIGKICNFLNGEKTAIDAVRQIREKACDILLKCENVQADGNDIVTNQNKGYAFGPKINVRVGGADPSENPDHRFTSNQLRILRELRKEHSIPRTLLGKRLDILVKALDAELNPLVQAGHVRRKGNGSALRIEMVNDPLPPSLTSGGNEPPPG